MESASTVAQNSTKQLKTAAKLLQGLIPFPALAVTPVPFTHQSAADGAWAGLYISGLFFLAAAAAWRRR